MTGSAQNGETNGPAEETPEADLSERRDRLNRLLEDQRKADEAERRKNSGNRSGAGYAQALKLSSEFIAGVLVGVGLGWFCDQWLGTGPFGLIVFLLLGFAAGVLNVLRSVGAVAPQDDRVTRGETGRNGGSDKD